MIVSSMSNLYMCVTYSSDDGKWDPERWYKATFVSSREASPLTLAEPKDRRRGLSDLDLKKRPSGESAWTLL